MSEFDPIKDDISGKRTRLELYHDLTAQYSKNTINITNFTKDVWQEADVGRGHRKMYGPKTMPTKYLYKLYVVAGFLPHDDVIMQKFIRLCSDVKRKVEQKKKGGKRNTHPDLGNKTILELLEFGKKGEVKSEKCEVTSSQDPIILMQEIIELRHERDLLKKKLEEKSQENVELTEELDAWIQKEKEMEDQKSQSEQILQTNDLLRTEMGKVEQKLAKAETQNEALKSKLVEKERENASLARKVKNLEKIMQDWTPVR
eukprot:TRINITY_DN30525_c0_g1_i16.p1 TRINITY_DN30525_c0_g1~~TRINITY_DN30525_c0_g1_i16.p1  ORF type:complete len:271 (-),score=65.12 TRINITY_DN30525_c0_g1_i16:78-851(-)